MNTQRFAQQMTKAMYYKFSEIWIAQQPFLFLTYFSTYMPALARQVMVNVVGPSRVRLLEEGGDAGDIKVQLLYTYIFALVIPFITLYFGFNKYLCYVHRNCLDLVVVRRETIGLGFVIPDRALVVIG